ncbi:MAG: alpha/beta fold hydrolase [Pseudomonadota bacterium]
MTVTRAGHAAAPSPLSAHLTAAASVYRTALNTPDLVPAHADAVAAEALVRMDDFLHGIERWRRAARPPAPVRPEPLWSIGNSSAHAYGDPSDPPVLVVPSLINRADILDLTEETSFLRALARHGVNPVLLDWGAPSPDTSSFGLEGYLHHRLMPALEAVHQHTGTRPALLGYCLGGTLSACLASLTPNAISALVCLAAPWAFPRDVTVPGGALRAAALGLGEARLDAMLHGLAASFGCVPGLLYQSLFAAIDPMQALPKFRSFAKLPLTSNAAQRFIAVEDWLAANRDTTLGVAQDVLIKLQMQDRLSRGQFVMEGQPVRAANITTPTLVILGQKDRIAPPELARPLAQSIPDSALLTPDLGHVGAIVSGSAQHQVISPIADFLLSHRA